MGVIAPELEIMVRRASRTQSIGRPRSFVLDDVVDATIPVFRAGGFHGTSLTDLGHAMRLAPGSIYKAFADKRAIFRHAFERYVSLRGETLRAAIEAASDGRAKLASFLRHYVASASGTEGRAGCLVVNAATELASTDPEIARRVSGVFESTETLLTGLLKAGQDDGSIRRDVDVAATARMLLCLVQGFRVVGKPGRDAADLDAVSNQCLRFLAP